MRPEHLWIGGGAIALAVLLAFLVFALLGRGPRDTLPLALLRAFTVLYAKLLHRLRVVGTDGRAYSGRDDPLPSTGPCIVVSNHRSSVDPVLLAVSTYRHVRFLMAQEYYDIPIIRRLFLALGCVPVRRDGTDLAAAKRALSLLERGEVVGVFPEGGIREGGPPQEGKGGIGLLALRSGAPVLPFFVEGSPHSPSVLRSIFTPSRTTIHVGRPLDFRSSGKPRREDYERVTEDILKAIAVMARGEAPPGEREPAEPAAPV